MSHCAIEREVLVCTLLLPLRIADSIGSYKLHANIGNMKDIANFELKIRQVNCLSSKSHPDQSTKVIHDLVNV